MSLTAVALVCIHNDKVDCDALHVAENSNMCS